MQKRLQGIQYIMQKNKNKNKEHGSKMRTCTKTSKFLLSHPLSINTLRNASDYWRGKKFRLTYLINVLFNLSASSCAFPSVNNLFPEDKESAISLRPCKVVLRSILYGMRIFR